MRRCLVAAVLLASFHSYADPMRIFPLDIFNNDSEMRGPSAKNDLRWTVFVGGCSGSMLSTKYMLTARHCGVAVGQSFTSGGCMELGCRNDLKAVRIVESSSTYDSTIVEVQWARVDSRWRQRYSPRIQTSADELTLGRDSQATALFTVG
ncbi:hypothetical protein K2X33_06080, partial [bacterium]|nr:hypothetical protein [bacterium]